MFEEFVQNKIDRETGSVFALSEITKEQIVKSDISDFTKNYFLIEFDSHSGRDEIADLICKSNKLYFNYTIRPKWTLQTFLFKNFESRPPNDLLNKLNYFPFYKFYSDSIQSFINESSPIFVTKTELISIIDNTNNAIYGKLTNDISNIKIKNFFLQIFLLKYESEINYNLESSVPYSFIKIFLEDKSYNQLTDKFTGIRDFSEDDEISLKDIIKILTDKYSSSTKEETSSPEYYGTVQDLTGKEKAAGENIESENPVEVELPAEVSKTKVEIPIYSEELSQAQKESKGTGEDSEKNNSFKIKNIKDLFEDKQSEKILDRIYNSDLLKRERSYEKLSSYKTWFEASNHLKEIFLSNEVDIYNKEVVKFVNTLNEYFKKQE